MQTRPRAVSGRTALTDKDREYIFNVLSPLIPRSREFTKAKRKLAAKFKYTPRGFDYTYHRILESRVPEEEILELKLSAEVATGEDRKAIRLRLIQNFHFTSEDHAETYLLKLIAS